MLAGSLRDVLSALDRLVGDLVSQKDDRRFLAQLIDFEQELETDPRTAAALRRLVEQFKNRLATHEQLRAQLRRSVLEMNRRMLAAYPSDESNLDPNSPEYFLSHTRLEALARREFELRSLLPSHPEDRDDDCDLLDLLRAIKQRIPTAEDSQLRREIDDVLELHEREWQSLKVDAMRFPGASLARVRSVASALAPSPLPIDEALRFRRFIDDRIGDVGAVAAGMFGTEPLDQKYGPKPSEVVVRLKDDIKHVVAQVKALLGRRESIHTLLLRYKQRAEWYEAERLRGRVEKNSRAGENLLSADLARFLFDQGLNPLLRPMVGRLQPDALVADPWSVYVEAKRYGDSNRRSYLIEGDVSTNFA